MAKTMAFLFKKELFNDSERLPNNAYNLALRIRIKVSTGVKMNKRILYLSIALTLALVMMACNLPFISITPQDTGLVATSVAQTVAALNKPSQDVPTVAPQIPTLGPAPTQTLSPLPTLALPPTATPLPCNWAKLVTETVADGTSININTNFNKSWRIRNAGTCTWNSNYKIAFYSGDGLGGPASKLFGRSVAPGETIDLILPLKAPATAGTYKGTWHLYSDSNVDFTTSYGIWASIIAVNPAPAFAVTSVNTTVDSDMGPFICPHNFIFTANITTNGPGTVTYQWKRSDASVPVTESLVFAAAGTKTVTTSWNLGGGTYTMRIYIDYPNHQPFNEVGIHCP
jgi:hypothetical protein